jgi:hypothetical protein
VDIDQQPKSKLIVLLHNRFFSNDDSGLGLSEEEVMESYSFVNSKKYFMNPWNNTRDISTCLQRNLDTMQKQGNQNRGRLIGNQFVMTPGVGSAMDVWNALIGKNSLRPVTWACRLYQNGILNSFLRQNATQPWNICTFDFIDLCPDVTDFLIGLNWQPKMEIQLAVVEGKTTNNTVIKEVVTDIIKPFCCRDRVLYLFDPIQDLGIPKDTESFTLTVAYSLAADTPEASFRVVTVPCDCNCPILVSQFCTNEGSETVILDEEFVGVVQGSRKFASVEEVEKAGCQGTKVQCTHDGECCKFEML